MFVQRKKRTEFVSDTGNQLDWAVCHVSSKSLSSITFLDF